jgi:peptidoglycan L-alanyl-D-glutamate endopeptidase CwlK
MPKFGSRSLKARNELHPELQRVVDAAIKEVDFMLLDAQRGRAEQEKAFKAGNSKARFGQSAHNWKPAVAFDMAPSPLSWDAAKFRPIAKTIMDCAGRLGIPIRWGADWDMDGTWKDERFLDWGHFELHPWREWAAKSKLIED